MHAAELATPLVQLRSPFGFGISRSEVTSQERAFHAGTRTEGGGAQSTPIVCSVPFAEVARAATATMASIKTADTRAIAAG